MSGTFPTLGAVRVRLGFASLALAAFVAVLGPSLAYAGAVPDGDGLAALDRRSAGSSRIGVQTERALYETSRYRFASSGVELMGPGGRTALIGTEAPGARLISWSEIESIDTYRYHTLRASVIGAAAGIALGGVVMARAGGPDLIETGDNAAVVLTEALAVTGAGVGLLIGLLAPQRMRIYP